MDTELARTFLSVIVAGSFIKASDQLRVTQSTVSARIQTLEAHLGCQLFERNQGGTTLTAAGKRFQKHAVNLMRTLEQARQDVGIPTGFRAALTLGGRIGVWEELLIRALPVIRQKMPDVSIRAEIGFEEDLMQGLLDGRMDIGLMYTPQSRPGLIVETLFEETLTLISTSGEQTGLGMKDYIHVDWGPEFRARHFTRFPEFQGAALSANIGWLGLQYLLEFGGSGYFPLRLVRDYIASARLHEVAGAPTFALNVYAVYPRDRDTDVFDPVLTIVRSTVATLGRDRNSRRTEVA